jgi:DNA-binding FadR family transcriptional regulator
LEAAVTNALTPPGGPAFALNFHVELAAASGNPVVEELIDSLLKVRLREQQQIRQLYDNRKRDYEEHRAIFEAVQAGDAAAAEQLTREHLDHIRTAIEAATFPELP